MVFGFAGFGVFGTARSNDQPSGPQLEFPWEWDSWETENSEKFVTLTFLRDTSQQTCQRFRGSMSILHWFLWLYKPSAPRGSRGWDARMWSPEWLENEPAMNQQWTTEKRVRCAIFRFELRKNTPPDPGGKIAKYVAKRPMDPKQLPLRRVIVATNAADTAVAFYRCWLCIDTRMVNHMMYDASLRAKVQQTVPCSQTASRQRGGRAGRDTPGMCLRLVTQLDPPQPHMDGQTALLDTLGMTNKDLRAEAQQMLFVHDLVDTYGQLTPKGIFVASLDWTRIWLPSLDCTWAEDIIRGNHHFYSVV